MMKSGIRLENLHPIISVANIGVSRGFYVDILGFDEADWGTDHFTYFGTGANGFYVCQGEQGKPGTWLWLGFEGDIYAFQEYLKMRGVRIIQEPRNFSWALEMRVEDPDGHVLRFGTEPDPSLPFDEA